MMAAVLAQATGIPQPEPLPLPAPFWLVWVLLIFTFLLHVIPMNLMLGGSLLAAVSRTKGTAYDLRLFQTFVKILPTIIAATVSFGVAPLLFVQLLYGRLLYTSSILIGWYWFGVIPILIVAYYGSYYLAFKHGSTGKASFWGIWIISILFLVIAFIYTNNMSLMLRPGVFVEKYLASGSGLHLNLDAPMLIPRYLHNLLGAIAVASLGIAVLGWINRKREPEFGAWAMRRGSVWFGITTIINMGVGVWFLFSLSRETLLGLMNPAGALYLMLGIVAGLVAVFLAMQAINATEPGSLVLGAVASLLLTLLSMILLRDQLRGIYLAQAGFEPVQWIVPDWGPILLFVALFVLMIVVVGWLVRLLVRAPKSGSTPS